MNSIVSQTAENMQNPLPKRTNKRVSFDKQVIVMPHMHINNFSDNEIESTWFSGRELELIKMDCVRILRKANVNHDYASSSECNCTRGLEFRAGSGAQERRNARFIAWDAVFEEQDQQCFEGVYDPDRIAEVYRACTLKSTRTALLWAHRDEMEVHGSHCDKTKNSKCLQIRRHAAGSDEKKNAKKPASSSIATKLIKICSAAA